MASKPFPDGDTHGSVHVFARYAGAIPGKNEHDVVVSEVPQGTPRSEQNRNAGGRLLRERRLYLTPNDLL
jgi:hypothetical protein